MEVEARKKYEPPLVTSCIGKCCISLVILTVFLYNVALTYHIFKNGSCLEKHRSQDYAAINSSHQHLLEDRISRLELRLQAIELSGPIVSDKNVQMIPTERGSRIKRSATSCVCPPGPKGDRGAKGDSGRRSEKRLIRRLYKEIASSFDDKLLYLKGEPGEQGSRGAQGPKGDRGRDGIPGISGKAGAKGEKGDSAFDFHKVSLLRGPPGLPGTTGRQGPKGDKGEIGPIGPQGVIGFSGRKGSKGEMGDRGPSGPAGKQGRQGEKGQKGELGGRPKVPIALPMTENGQKMKYIQVQGPPGPAGPKGEKGDSGEAGAPGFPGRDGVPGRPGEPGKEGKQGKQGEAGQPGKLGDQGPRGEKGRRGKRGKRGERGPQGDNGKTCWLRLDGTSIDESCKVPKTLEKDLKLLNKAAAKSSNKAKVNNNLQWTGIDLNSPKRPLANNELYKHVATQPFYKTGLCNTKECRKQKRERKRKRRKRKGRNRKKRHWRKRERKEKKKAKEKEKNKISPKYSYGTYSKAAKSNWKT